MPSYRTSLTLESLRDLSDLLENLHMQGGMSDGLIDARRAINLRLIEVDAGSARPNNVTRNNGTNKYEPVSRQANSSTEPSWVNDPNMLSTTDPVLKKAFTMAMNQFISTGKYPPSLDSFIADIKGESDKMAAFSADDL